MKGPHSTWGLLTLLMDGVDIAKIELLPSTKLSYLFSSLRKVITSISISITTAQRFRSNKRFDSRFVDMLPGTCCCDIYTRSCTWDVDRLDWLGGRLKGTKRSQGSLRRVPERP
jgi:hypothetical protein